MKKLILAMSTALIIVCIMSVTTFAVSSEEFNFHPILTGTEEKESLPHEHEYSNIGFVATQLASNINQDLYVALKHNSFLMYNQVGERIICTSNKVNGGFTWTGCSTDGKYHKMCQHKNVLTHLMIFTAILCAALYHPETLRYSNRCLNKLMYLKIYTKTCFHSNRTRFFAKLSVFNLSAKSITQKLCSFI